MTKKMKAFKEKCEKNSKIFDQQASQYKTRREQMAKCSDFMNRLADILKGKYELIGSCNKDMSQYLIPVGTRNQVTYYGKPELSFRVSDHWNWYSHKNKCRDLNYIQCNSLDVPEAYRRQNEFATDSIKACQVAIQGTDGNYHHVYGEKYDRENRIWEWVETNPMDICVAYGLV